MAGIYHKYFSADSVNSDELHYFAITLDKLVPSFSWNFRDHLQRMGHLEYNDDKKPNEAHYFEVIATTSAEYLFFSYLKQNIPSITAKEVRCFFRGSKRLPGGDSEDPEQDFWIIEPKKIENILQFLNHYDFNQTLALPSLPQFPVDKESLKSYFLVHPGEKYDLNYYDFEDLLQIVTFLYSNLKKGNVILCVWDQS